MIERIEYDMPNGNSVTLNGDEFAVMQQAAMQARVEYAEAMNQVNKAILEAVPGITRQTAIENCEVFTDRETSISVITYKGRPIVRFGFNLKSKVIDTTMSAEWFVERVDPINL